MKSRMVCVALVALLAAACSGGGSSTGKGGDGGLGESTTVQSTENAACKNATLSSPEVGVTDKTITVTTVADVDNAARPGVFKGSWDGMKAWAEYMNANGGLACRKVVVKTVDSHLSGDDSKAAVAQACKDSVATVGTTALFLTDVRGMEACPDKSGTSKGLPDIALIQSDAAQQCSPISYPALPTNQSCPYSGTGPRQYKISPTIYDYFVKNFGSLNGTFVVPKDTPSSISQTFPIVRGYQTLGVKQDAEFGISALAPQPQYSPVAQTIKSKQSNFVMNMSDYKSNVLLRKEVATQSAGGSVKVFNCLLNCYDTRLLQEGGKDVDGQYVWLSFLPIEDKGSNAELDAFLKYDKDPEGFGMQAWIAGEVFATAVNNAIKANGNDPNAVTRPNVLTALSNLHSFDANGMAAKIDVGNRTGSTCVVGMQVKGGKFVRVQPTEPGKFDCGTKPLVEYTLDPTTFKG
jgi:hypothetical protein